MKVYKNIYPLIISAENLFAAWEIFKRDKRNKPDVMEIEQNIEQEIFKLHRELRNKTYKHGPYSGFWLRDPKLRRIHKATVRDRILHHAIFRVLNPIFEPTFIPNSYSCRVGKGTHKGVEDLEKMIRAESRNHTKECWVLKCDIRKFFDSVDHRLLLGILERKVVDCDTRWLLREVIGSYTSANAGGGHKGIPIGNLTSQIFANVYMNKLDQFIKHELKVKHYVRYTDDFIIISQDKIYLEKLLPLLKSFLTERLTLTLHPNKVTIRKYRQGTDFLGYVILPRYILVRKKTERRIFRQLRLRAESYRKGDIEEVALYASLRSYLGVLSHADAYKVTERLINEVWFWSKE